MRELLDVREILYNSSEMVLDITEISLNSETPTLS